MSLNNVDNASGLNAEIPTKDNIVGRSDSYESFNTLINEQKEYLFERAESLVGLYLAEHEIENVSRKHTDRGYVFCRARLRDKANYKNIEISWYKMNVVMAGNNRVKLSKHISKGKSTIYPMSRFAKHAKDWELELIEQAEKQFQPIRECLLSLKMVTQGFKSFRANDQKSINLSENS